MFALTIIDQVQLDAEYVARNYAVHARAAERIGAAASGMRIGIASLQALTTAVAILAVLDPIRPWLITTAAIASLATLAHFVSAILNVESRLLAHRSLAHRLWLVSERYRSLLAEMNEGAVDSPALLRRRDELMRDLHAVYEVGVGALGAGYEGLRLPPLSEPRAA